MKTCTKCKETKEFLEFYKSKSSKDGYALWCKHCDKSQKLEKKINPELQIRALLRSSVTLENRMLFKEGKRVCSSCGQIYLISSMNHTYCLPCRRVRDKLTRSTEEGKLRKSTTDKKSYYKNIEKRKVASKAYREANKEIIRIKKKEYNDRTKEQKRLYDIAYRARKKAEKLKQLEEKL